MSLGAWLGPLMARSFYGVHHVVQKIYIGLFPYKFVPEFPLKFLQYQEMYGIYTILGTLEKHAMGCWWASVAHICMDTCMREIALIQNHHYAPCHGVDLAGNTPWFAIVASYKSIFDWRKMAKIQTRSEFGWYKLVLFVWGQICPNSQYIYKSFCMSWKW